VFVVGGRVSRRLKVGLEPLAHPPEVPVGLTLRVITALEEVGLTGALWLRLDQIVHQEAEPAGKPEHDLVVGVDLLAAPLTHLALVPVIGE